MEGMGILVLAILGELGNTRFVIYWSLGRCDGYWAGRFLVWIKKSMFGRIMIFT
jgi:hypothetical protein